MYVGCIKLPKITFHKTNNLKRILNDALEPNKPYLDSVSSLFRPLLYLTVGLPPELPHNQQSQIHQSSAVLHVVWRDWETR